MRPEFPAGVVVVTAAPAATVVVTATTGAAVVVVLSTCTPRTSVGAVVDVVAVGDNAALLIGSTTSSLQLTAAMMPTRNSAAATAMSGPRARDAPVNTVSSTLPLLSASYPRPNFTGRFSRRNGRVG